MTTDKLSRARAVVRDAKEARRWLRAIDLEPTAELTQWLIGAAAFRPGTHGHRIASDFIRKGRRPTHEAVSSHIRRSNAKRRRWRRQAVTLLAQPGVTDEVLTWINDCWQTTGAGPTWTEAAQHMGWSSALWKGVLHELAASGRVVFDEQARSLRCQDVEPKNGPN